MVVSKTVSLVMESLLTAPVTVATLCPVTGEHAVSAKYNLQDDKIFCKYKTPTKR